MTILSAFGLWVLTVLHFLAPLQRHYKWDKLDETDEAREERYIGIAQSIDRVVHLEGEKLPFAGEHGKAWTAAYLLAISYYESGFYRGVDLGIGKMARGDYGRSACLMQIQVGKGTTAEGWTAEDLVADRDKCFLAGMRILRRSLLACRALPQKDRLSGYTSGKCQENEPAALTRYREAHRIMEQFPRPKKNAEKTARVDTSSP
jgi:hypothetical protein